MRVVFTKVAESSYERILEFLAITWTEREMEIFVNDAEVVEQNLKEGRYLMYQKSRFKTRSALIGKNHVRMFFRKENKELIKVLLFFDMREDPQKILELLKQ